MPRPRLNPSISAAEFRDSYWLKTELQKFCREQGLPTTGGKIDIANRIIAFLTGDPVPVSPQPSSRNATMPNTFSEATVIEPGWRCTQLLRAYFQSVHGRGFRFNAALRDFIRTGIGQTLADASERYEASLKEQRRPIDRQFEYNRHMREFFDANPSATRQEAIDAWWEMRGSPDS